MLPTTTALVHTLIPDTIVMETAWKTPMEILFVTPSRWQAVRKKELVIMTQPQQTLLHVSTLSTSMVWTTLIVMAVV